MRVRHLDEGDLRAVEVVRLQLDGFFDALPPRGIVPAACARIGTRRGRDNAELRVEEEQLHPAIDRVALLVLWLRVELVARVVEWEVLTAAVGQRFDLDAAVCERRAVERHVLLDQLRARFGPGFAIYRELARALVPA